MSRLALAVLLVCSCAAESVESEETSHFANGKADGFCNGPVTAVTVMPPQWPPSRIGDPIADYIPANLGAPDREIADGDSVVRFWDNPMPETSRISVSYANGAIVVVSVEETDGSSLLLWGDNGFVYWEQRQDEASGRFENSFDQDRNGYIDDLRTGVTGCLEHSYRLSEEAAAKQEVRGNRSELPAASELISPHAELRESRSLVIAWDREIERAEVSYRVLWSELVPALPRDVVTNATEVRVSENWLAGADEVEMHFDAAGFSFRAKNVYGSAWGSAPIIQVLATGRAPEEIALFSPKFISDDTINQRESATETVEATDQHIAYLETEIAQAQAAVANPNDINEAVLNDIEAAETRITELDAEITAARPDVAARWDAATREAQFAAVDAIQGAVSEEQRQQLDALRTKLAQATVPSSQLPPESQDLALAALLGTQGEPNHVFVLQVTERQELVQTELPKLRQTLTEANSQTVAYYQRRIDDLSQTLDQAKSLRRETEARLRRLERAPSLSLLGTQHKPYTF